MSNRSRRSASNSTRRSSRHYVPNAPVDTSVETRVGRNVEVLASGCWIYNGDPHHYGHVGYRGASGTVGAHRFVYETLVGPIGSGLELHHECENPGCVNPEHLTPMEHGEHMTRHAELRRLAS